MQRYTCSLLSSIKKAVSVEVLRNSALLPQHFIPIYKVKCYLDTADGMFSLLPPEAEDSMRNQFWGSVSWGKDCKKSERVKGNLAELWRSPPPIWLSKNPKLALSFELSAWELSQLIARITQEKSIHELFRTLNKGCYPKVIGDLDLHACLPFLLSKCWCDFWSMPNQARIWSLYQLSMGIFFLRYKFSLITMSHHQ